jgi:lysosomal acid lipase/cholesteryl ester hydrolase
LCKLHGYPGLQY